MAGSNDDLFTFIPIDWRCKPAQEAIRVHIMRQRHRQARRDRKSPQARRYKRQSGEEIHLWAPLDDHSDRSEDWLGSRCENFSSSRNSEFLPLDLCQVPGDRHWGLRLYSPILSPASSGNLNSVINPPVPSPSDVEEILLRHYLQYAGGSPVTHQLLRVYRDTAGAFNAFLAIIARNHADENGRNPLLNIIELENEALKEVSAQLSQSPTIPTCSTMMTVAMLASLCECLHQTDMVKSHWSALQQMVDINGGICRLRVHRDLYSFLLLTEAVVLRTISSSIAHPQRVRVYASAMNQELQDFLREIHQQFEVRVITSDSLGPGLSGPILSVLCQPPHKKDPYSLGKWHRARLACVLFFTVLDLRCAGLLKDGICYRAVEMDIVDRAQNYVVYPEELFYIIIHSTNQDRHCQFIWETLRLICAVKSLCQRDLNTCWRLLTTWLGIPDLFDLTMLLDECNELSDRVDTF